MIGFKLFLFSLFLIYATDYSGRTFTSREQYENSEGGTFTTCTFTGCTIDAEDCGGGALYLNASDASLVVDNCIFSNCSSLGNFTSGGAISCTNTGTFIVRNESKFMGCWASLRGGSIFAAAVSKCFFVHGGEVSECYVASSHGGGMFLLSCPNQPVASTCSDRSEFQSGVLFDLNIKNCTADSWGGGLFLTSPKEGFSVRNCEFSGCNGSCGGAIYLRVDSSYGSYKTFFEYVYFDDNYAIAIGHDICCASANQSIFNTTAGPFNRDTSSSNTPSTPSRARGYAALTEGNADEKWLPFGVFVNNESSLTESCGKWKVKDFACNSLFAAAQEERAKHSCPIVFLQGTHSKEKESITIGGQFASHLQLKGDGSSVLVQLQEIEGEAWVVVASEGVFNLSMLNVSILQKEGSTEFSSSLFFVLGSLYLKSVCLLSEGTIICSQPLLSLAGGMSVFVSLSLSSVALSSASPISITDGTFFSFEDCLFSSVVKDGNGGVISNEGKNAPTSLSQQISLSNSTFDQCTANGGDGGAVYVCLRRGTVLKICADSQDKETTFKSCQAKQLPSERREPLSGKGGALCLSVDPEFKVSSTPYTKNPLLGLIQFGKDEEKNVASLGQDMFVFGAFKQLVSSTNFPVLNQWIDNTSSSHPHFLEGWDTQAVGLKQGATHSVLPLLTIRYEEEDKKKKSGLSVEAVVGIALGAVAVLAMAIVAVVLFVLCKTHKGCFKRKEEPPQEALLGNKANSLSNC